MSRDPEGNGGCGFISVSAPKGASVGLMRVKLSSGLLSVIIQPLLELEL